MSRLVPGWDQEEKEGFSPAVVTKSNLAPFAKVRPVVERQDVGARRASLFRKPAKQKGGGLVS